MGWLSVKDNLTSVVVLSSGPPRWSGRFSMHDLLWQPLTVHVEQFLWTPAVWSLCSYFSNEAFAVLFFLFFFEHLIVWDSWRQTKPCPPHQAHISFCLMGLVPCSDTSLKTSSPHNSRRNPNVQTRSLLVSRIRHFLHVMWRSCNLKNIFYSVNHFVRWLIENFESAFEVQLVAIFYFFFSMKFPLTN